uniref:Uncharacterized protein n=1 Tax=Opuntia streptacantha TaxID=393608 RepID=A0A7C8YRW9_OPUST
MLFRLEATSQSALLLLGEACELSSWMTSVFFIALMAKTHLLWGYFFFHFCLFFFVWGGGVLSVLVFFFYTLQERKKGPKKGGTFFGFEGFAAVVSFLFFF